MDSIKDLGKTSKSRVETFFSGKPIWVYWIAHTLLTGVIFGIFYLAVSLLLIKWWATVAVLIALGIIWGSISFAKKSKEPESTEPAE